jgi:hypothetical protein
MKAILKTSAANGISIMEARTQHNWLSAERSNAHLPRHLPPLIALLAKSRISALQVELKLVKETIIPVMNQSIKTISADLADTREKITHFDTRFDAIEKPQGENLLK